MMLRSPLRCWYELGFDLLKPAILIRVRDEVYRQFQQDTLANNYIIEALGQEMGLKGFQNDAEYFGFGQTLKKAYKKDGFVTLLLEIPQVRILTDKDCATCHGTGKDNFQEKCFSCFGQKKECAYSWEKAIAGSASLTALFWMLDRQQGVREIALAREKKQLLILQTVTRKSSLEAGTIVGAFGEEIQQWFLTRSKLSNIDQVSQSIERVYSCMEGGMEIDEGRFHVFVEHGGWLMIECSPRCCLYPSSREYNGYPFSTVDVNSAIEQFMLLAALGTLHDMARGEGV